MYRKAIVKRVTGKSGWVSLLDSNEQTTTACSSGNQCSSCHMDCKKPNLVFVDEMLDAQEGDLVELYIQNGSFLFATMISLLFPLLMLVIGILLGRGVLYKQFIFGSAFFLIAVAIAYLLDKRFKASIQVSHIIERCYEKE
ncbi:MAG: SoxR reducing system RseC family protein [Caldisericia bacterium]|nr:SoxR reducing system RseC family protein [Caldisericia bacterium]MDD4614277.1 SoxR reducing system RseC family protein [Caldisericia bacterium]